MAKVTVVAIVTVNYVISNRLSLMDRVHRRFSEQPPEITKLDTRIANEGGTSSLSTFCLRSLLMKPFSSIMGKRYIQFMLTSVFIQCPLNALYNIL